MTDKKTKPQRHTRSAWLVGLGIYMVLALEVIANAGVLAVPFQFAIGAVVSIIFVGAATLAGLLLRLPGLDRIWHSSAIPSVTVLACSIFLIFFGRSLGLTTTITSPETNTDFQTLHPAIAWGGMFAAVFAALHFSTRTGLGRRTDEEVTENQE